MKYLVRKSKRLPGYWDVVNEKGEIITEGYSSKFEAEWVASHILPKKELIEEFEFACKEHGIEDACKELDKAFREITENFLLTNLSN